MIKIGFSKDIHRLEKGITLMLAAVNIPSPHGPIAHSDGDVILHAVSEAILGALALGDLGAHFPPSIRKTKGMASTVIIEGVMKMMKAEGFHVSNVDVFVSLEEPKLAPHIMVLRQNLSYLLETDVKNVSIKAGTNEGLDSVGRKEAIEATATVLLTND